MVSLFVEGTYENGTIKLDRPLPLKENERVRFSILEATDTHAALAVVERTYGLIPWAGDPEAIRLIAEEPDFGISESSWT